jgi:hypothetical chaperone protein
VKSAPGICAIDFGTSNSALALVRAGAHAAGPAGFELVELEAGATSIPTAVFFDGEDGSRQFGRAAVRAYVEGHEGRLMRSIKSILGSDLIERTTEVGPGIAVRYLDVVVAFLRHVRERAQTAAAGPLTHALIGRPVFFVDGDVKRDRAAQSTLAAAARAAGFAEVEFEFEPIAAARDFERTVTRETRVLVADIGGGTSDFSVVRVGAAASRKAARDRSADVLASHGVHVAGTDFDREVNLAAIMPALGLGSAGRSESGALVQVPNSIYHALATWHLINTCYAPNRLIELRQMASLYVEARLHGRLMRVLGRHLGHHLAARAEAAKIDVASNGQARIDLSAVEAGLEVLFDGERQALALQAATARIVEAAGEAIRLAGLQPAGIDALYFTGGSTALGSLADAIAAAVPQAQRVAGDRFASVVSGLALEARTRFVAG